MFIPFGGMAGPSLSRHLQSECAAFAQSVPSLMTTGPAPCATILGPSASLSVARSLQLDTVPRRSVESFRCGIIPDYL